MTALARRPLSGKKKGFVSEAVGTLFVIIKDRS